MGHSDFQVPPGTGSGAARCRARVRPKHAQCKVRASTRHHAISFPYLVFVCCGATVRAILVLAITQRAALGALGG